MLVNIKKLIPEAVIPTYAKQGDAGMDLTAVDSVLTEYTQFGKVITYRTGLSIEVPKGHVAYLHPRSSVYKTGMILANSTGVIDSGYRGEILVKFYAKGGCQPYQIGDRIAQIVILPYPEILFKETDSLTDTERGATGFGSSGGF